MNTINETLKILAILILASVAIFAVSSAFAPESPSQSTIEY